MLLLRLIGLLALITIGVSLALYAFYREPRYLRFAWRDFLVTLAFALALALGGDGSWRAPMGIVVIGVIAYLFDLLMRWVERKLVPWKGRM